MPPDSTQAPFRVAIANVLAALPEADGDGVWRLDDLGIEVVIDPVLRETAGNPLAPRIADACRRAGWDGCDLYIHQIPEYRALPVDVFSTPRRRLLLTGDWNLGAVTARLLRPWFPAIACDHAGVEAMRGLGYQTVIPQLVWGWDPVTWPLAAPRSRRDIDVLFVGNRNPAIHAERERRLAMLARSAPGRDVRIVTDVHGSRNHELHTRAKLVFNYSVRGEANMRSFEAAAAGACVLNERGNPTLPRVFEPGRDYAEYDEGDLAEVISELLGDDRRRVTIAEHGQRVVARHTYADHWRALLGHLAREVPGWDAPPEPDERTALEVLAEQWRLASAAVYRRHIRSLTTRHPSARYRGRADLLVLRETVEAGDGAAAEAPRLVDAGATLGALDDPAVALCLAWTEFGTAESVARPSTLAGLHSGRFDEFRTALERIALTPGPEHGLRHELSTWAERQLRLVRATGAIGRDDPRRIAASLADDGGHHSMVTLRARAHLAAGEIDAGIADLVWCLRDLPTDVESAVLLGEALRAAGRHEEAVAVIDDLRMVVTPDNRFGAETRDALHRARAALAAPPGDHAICWVEPYDAHAIAAIVRARVAGGIPEPEIQCVAASPQAAGDLLGAFSSALEDLGVGGDDIGDISIVAPAAARWDRWRDVASCGRVLARRGSFEHLLAEALARPVLILEEPPAGDLLGPPGRGRATSGAATTVVAAR
ncbi:MAG: glycosyltransferase family 1 protein [Thermoleophilia bacterium]|nr:glycosyltransferase family 1 protein [Thermoleophilia bacterium]